MNPIRILTRRAYVARAFYSHRYVRSSYVWNFDTIDRTARIKFSRILGDVVIGPKAVLNHCEVTANARVSVGAYSILTGPVRIVADLKPISIGKFCSFAPDVTIWEALHNMSRISTFFMLQEMFGESAYSDGMSKGAIQVGNDVWIGTRAIVLSGVEIGDGAVIGAGAVVTKDVPPYSVAVGSPATVVKQRFPEAISRRLLEMRWWDWEEDRIRRYRELFEQNLTPQMLDRIAR